MGIAAGSPEVGGVVVLRCAPYRIARTTCCLVNFSSGRSSFSHGVGLAKVCCVSGSLGSCIVLMSVIVILC